MTDFFEINKIISFFNDKKAELPNTMKTSISTVAICIINNNNDPIGFVCVDIYNAKGTTGVKFMNIFVKKEERNKKIASRLIEELEKFTISFIKAEINNGNNYYKSKNITFVANAIGDDKDIICKIFNKKNYVLDKTSKKISYFKEID